MLPPGYILLYNFLVTHPNFMKFDGFSKTLSGINFLEFFLQNSNWFVQCHHFFTTKFYYWCMSSVGIMNISLATLVVRESRVFRKKLIFTFLVTPFQWARLL